MKAVSLKVSALALAVSSVVQAEDVVESEAVTVWGTEIQASSVNMDGEALAIRQADHVSDLLRTIPGVDVGGAHSLNQRITIRSMDDKDLRISIDGANQNTYMYHHMGNLQIHADILKSVDIEVGNNSVVNGGLGGVVRFETKSADDLLRPGQRVGAHVQATWASNAYRSAAATAYGKLTDSVDVLGYYSLLQRDNYEVGEGQIVDRNGDEIEGTDGTVKGLEGDLDNALLKFGWNITPNQRLSLGYEMYVDEGDYSYRPDMGLATDLAIAENLGVPLTYPTEFTRDTYTLNYDASFDQTRVKATLFMNESTLERDERGFADTFPDFAGIVTGEATNTGLNVLASTWIDGSFAHDLRYGVEYIQYDTEYRANYDTGVFSATSSEEASSAAIFIEDRIELGGGFAVTPGIRYNYYDIDATVVSDTFDEITGALALEYQPNDHVLLHASSTQLFKGPEIGEVFIGAGLDDTPNPDIQAETGFNHEIGFALQESLGNERVYTGLTLFQTDINDYIYDYARRDDFRGKDNIGDMQITGFEAYVGVDVDTLRVLFTLSRAESELSATEEYPQYDGARLDRQQGDTMSLIVDYAVPDTDWALHWDLLRVASVPDAFGLDSATLDNSKDAYVVNNVSARWAPRRYDGLTLTVGIDNLFDEFYASQSSRTGTSLHPRFGELYLVDYEPGRNVKVTVGYQL